MNVKRQSLRTVAFARLEIEKISFRMQRANVSGLTSQQT